MSEYYINLLKDSFECSIDLNSNGNETLAHNECPTNATCSSVRYKSVLFNQTVVTKWNLICDHAAANGFTITYLRLWCLLYFLRNVLSLGLLGLFFGAILFGYLSDQIGRKHSLLISAIGSSIFSIFVGLFSKNLMLYTLFRFLAGLFVHGSIPVSIWNNPTFGVIIN